MPAAGSEEPEPTESNGNNAGSAAEASARAPAWNRKRDCPGWAAARANAFADTGGLRTAAPRARRFVEELAGSQSRLPSKYRDMPASNENRPCEGRTRARFEDFGAPAQDTAARRRFSSGSFTARAADAPEAMPV